MPRKIISASRRSDIPALYSRWFLRRLEEGFCDWIQPFGGQLNRVSLKAEDCLAIVFWTRNPAPLLPALQGLKAGGYFFYFHFTLTGYPEELETCNPSLEASLRNLQKLAELAGPEAVIWRYDPIVLSSRTPIDFHLRRFARIAREIQGATRQVYISFVDLYGKTKKNFEALNQKFGIGFQEPDFREKKELALRLADRASRHGMMLYACCEDELIDAGGGIQKGHCVDIVTVRCLRPGTNEAPKRRPTRDQCGCTESVDIGAYDTCPLGCTYCYATRSRDAALARLHDHDPADPLLWRPPHLRGAEPQQAEAI